MQLEEDDTAITTTLDDVLTTQSLNLYNRQDTTNQQQNEDTTIPAAKLIDENNLININEDEERKRFQIELEFVQSLANPDYLNYLAQRGYFKNQTFINYLKYLMYWKQPEYVKYITYPQCLALLELLQHENFLKEIANQQCSKYINDQLLLLWLHYKKKHEWKTYDPTKIPTNVVELIKQNQ
jgi:mediator of RNA polymerase II transcription subunit 31